MFSSFNIYLFSQLILYISSLFIGFYIQSSQKNTLNKKYKLYKPYLTFMLISILSLSGGVLAYLTFSNYFFGILFILHMLFIIYMIWGLDKNTRCWKQHRMIYYNFYLIIILYISSLFLSRGDFLFYTIFLLICIYTVLEFQFAKFSLKQTLMWD